MAPTTTTAVLVAVLLMGTAAATAAAAASPKAHHATAAAAADGIFTNVYGVPSRKLPTGPASTGPKFSPFVTELVGNMTLQEKIGQMSILLFTQLFPAGATNFTNPDPLLMAEVMGTHGIGNFFAGAMDAAGWIELITNLQKFALTHTRLKIPILYGIDAVHGGTFLYGATFFPQNIGLAASFDTDLMAACQSITAFEMRTAGLHRSFTPVLGVTMSPFWPRVYEGFGEDPVVCGEMGVAYIQGLQGNDLSADTSMAATAKHFLGYSYPNINHKDRTMAWIDERQLRQYFVPPFAQAFSRTNVQAVVANSAAINGIPVHANPAILTDLLKKELGFTGGLAANFRDIYHLYATHKVAPSLMDATRIAINAGIDLSMDVQLNFTDNLYHLVNIGAVNMSRIDEAVSQQLQMKYNLGLFDSAKVFPNPQNPNIAMIGSRAHRNVSLEAARQSIVLLKNVGNLLPLDRDTIKNVFVTGPGANSLSLQNGGWSIGMQGAPDSQYPFGVTLHDGLTMLTEGTSTQITTANWTNTPAVQAGAKYAGACVVAVAEQPYAEVMGNIEDLDLDADQIALIQTVYATGCPTIVVVMQGRPRTMPWVIDNVPAIFNAFLPGSEGGQALAELIFGVTADNVPLSPSAKLTISYPHHQGDLGQYYYAPSAASPDQGNTDVFLPAYPFGHGLAYNNYSYSKLTLNTTQAPLAQPYVGVSVCVTNTGKIDSKETVLLYIHDVYASVVQPVFGHLKHFARLSLKAGETQCPTFTITPEDLSFIGLDNTPVIEAGEFQVIINRDTLSATFNVVA